MDCRNIPICSVLDKLGIKYKQMQGDEYRVYDGSTLSDGWTFNKSVGLMHNFTPDKDRPSGSVIDLVMRAKRLNTREAIQRLEKEFNIEQQKKPTIWDGLASVPEVGIAYLKSRGIDYNKVRSFVKRKDGLALAVYKNNQRAGIAIRTLSNDKKQRFRSVKGTDGKAVYMHNLDTSKDYIYIVEGFFDFLTLRQFIPNVIGLRSASDGIEIVKEYAKTHQLILCPHNDAAGANLTKQLEENGCFVFDVSKVSKDCNDLNDIWMEMLAGGEDDILLLIDGLKQKREYTDDSVFKRYDRQFKTDVTTPVPFTHGVPKLDDIFGKIEKGRFMTTLGESGSGKTTRAFHQGLAISREYKVLFISLEMDAQRVIELRSRKMSGITLQEWNDKKIPAWKIENMKIAQNEIKNNRNLEIVGSNTDGPITHNQIIDTIKIGYMDYDRFIIDNLGFIQCGDSTGKSDYNDLNKIVRGFKDFCHEYGKNVNLLHHFNKGKSGKDRRDRSFADALGTGKLEHDVDYGVFVARSSRDDDDTPTLQEQSEVYIKLAKDRENGINKKAVVYFQRGAYYGDYDASL